MSEELNLHSASCPRCGLTFTCFGDDALRKQLEIAVEALRMFAIDHKVIIRVLGIDNCVACTAENALSKIEALKQLEAK